MFMSVEVYIYKSTDGINFTERVLLKYSHVHDCRTYDIPLSGAILASGCVTLGILQNSSSRTPKTCTLKEIFAYWKFDLRCIFPDILIIPDIHLHNELSAEEEAHRETASSTSALEYGASSSTSITSHLCRTFPIPTSEQDVTYICILILSCTTHTFSIWYFSLTSFKVIAYFLYIFFYLLYSIYVFLLPEASLLPSHIDSRSEDSASSVCRMATPDVHLPNELSAEENAHRETASSTSALEFGASSSTSITPRLCRTCPTLTTRQDTLLDIYIYINIYIYIFLYFPILYL